MGVDSEERNGERTASAWPSAIDSIGLLSSPLTNPRQVDALTKSPKPGGRGPTRIRVQRSKNEEACDFKQLQKVRSLEIRQRKLREDFARMMIAGRVLCRRQK